MKRQNDNIESFVHAYGCGRLLEGADYIEAEAKLMSALWDSLVTIERRYEREIEQAAGKDVPEINAILVLLQNLTQLIIETEGENRRQLVLQRRQVRKTLWAPLTAWIKANKDKMKEINKTRLERVAEARKASGLYWGNYNAVIQRYETARIAVKKVGRRLRFFDPERDDGCLTVQIQKTPSGLGAKASELQDGTVSAIQVGLVDKDAYNIYVPRGERRRLCQTKLQMRVDAAGHMMTINVWMHRELPGDVRIKQVQLTWRKEGNRLRYSVCFTLSRTKKGDFVRTGKEGTIRIAPRVEKKSLVVAVTPDDKEIVALDKEWMHQMDRVDRLPSLIKNDNLPETLRVGWERERPGLWRRLLLRRREIYRLSAIALVQAYAKITIETPPLAKLAREDRGTEQNSIRQRACAHNLIAEIKNQARKYGTTIEVITKKEDRSQG